VNSIYLYVALRDVQNGSMDFAVCGDTGRGNCFFLWFVCFVGGGSSLLAIEAAMVCVHGRGLQLPRGVQACGSDPKKNFAGGKRRTWLRASQRAGRDCPRVVMPQKALYRSHCTQQTGDCDHGPAKAIRPPRSHDHLTWTGPDIPKCRPWSLFPLRAATRMLMHKGAQNTKRRKTAQSPLFANRQHLGL
jgi:hypothetical protein